MGDPCTREVSHAELLETVGARGIAQHSCGLGETDSITTEVVDRVVTTEEDITYTHHTQQKNQNLARIKLTDDPKEASGKVDIHAGE